MRLQRNITCLFCEDIKEITEAGDILIGVAPNNIALSKIPASIPKFSIYFKLDMPLDQVTRNITLRLEGPGDASRVFEIDSEGRIDLDHEVTKAKSEGAPYVGIISKIVMSPFRINVFGRFNLVAIVDGEEILAGSVNFVQAKQI